MMHSKIDCSSEMPLVSIVIPVYNGSNYLADAIESVLGQTYPACEVLVINDGSTDEGATAAIAHRYDGSIRYFEKANGGVASALNEGIRQMHGTYFAWLSHDDTFLPEKIAWQMERIQASGDPTTIAQANYIFENVATGTSIATPYDVLYGMDRVARGVFLLLWTEEHFSNLLVHRSHFDRVGLFDEGNLTAQDQEMQFRLLRGQKTVFEPHPVSRIRMHDASGTHTMHERLLVENRKMYLDALHALSEQEIVWEFGRRSTLYCHVAAVLFSMGGGEELASVEELLRESIQEERGTQNLDNIGEDMPPVYLFGAGQYGRRLRYELAARRIPVACFFDNDARKDGTCIDGVPCHLPDQIPRNGAGVLIIAQKAYGDAMRQAQGLTQLTCMTKYKADQWLFEHPPIRLPEACI
ncbi:MAG: glycosyltransferase [Selenomonas bovis]|nr:glycosyltransferase [Selenomonas bovis]